MSHGHFLLSDLISFLTNTCNVLDIKFGPSELLLFHNMVNRIGHVSNHESFIL